MQYNMHSIHYLYIIYIYTTSVIPKTYKLDLWVYISILKNYITVYESMKAVGGKGAQFLYSGQYTSFKGYFSPLQMEKYVRRTYAYYGKQGLTITLKLFLNNCCMSVRKVVMPLKIQNKAKDAKIYVPKDSKLNI